MTFFGMKSAAYKRREVYRAEKHSGSHSHSSAEENKAPTEA